MMTARYDAKLAAIDVLPPDTYFPYESRAPESEFVISRFPDGSVASRYGDNIWDLSTWHPDNALKRLYFDFWKDGVADPARRALSNEAKWIVFSLVWLRNGSPFAVSTLDNFLTVLRSMAKYCENSRQSLTDLLSDDKAIRKYVEVACSPSLSSSLSAIFSHLRKLPSDLLGFNVVGSKSLGSLKSLVASVKAATKQTPPIPTRIYSSILSKLVHELREWESIASECIQLMVNCANDPCLGRKIATQEKTRLRRKLTQDVRAEWQALASPGIRAYLGARGHDDSILGFGSAITDIQVVAKLTIQAFSGMRDDEGAKLPYHCDGTVILDGVAYKLINGRTTKLSKKRASWVTNSEGHLAIKIAQQIASAIYLRCGVSEIPEYKLFDRFSRFPLFVSVAYLGFGNGHSRMRPENDFFVSGGLALDRHRKLMQRLQPVVEHADLLELEAIDEHRSWRSEERFQVGLMWTLATHQLRRSLALYAQRSGMVTLTSLRQQLHHLTEAMSKFYARGAEYATHLFGAEHRDKAHFSNEWELAATESAAFAYVKNVLLTDERLFGGHAAFVQRRTVREGGQVAVETRVQTMQLFKKGLLAYRETLMGGCTRIDECANPAVDWLNVECVRNNCADLVGSVRKLALVVDEQSKLVSLLQRSTLEYRTESATLAVLKKALSQAENDNVSGY